MNRENDPQTPLLEGTNSTPSGESPARGLRKSGLARILILPEPTDEAANQTDLRVIANRCLVAFVLGFIIGQGEGGYLWAGLF